MLVNAYAWRDNDYAEWNLVKNIEIGYETTDAFVQWWAFYSRS